jgi:hypothetical protein
MFDRVKAHVTLVRIISLLLLSPCVTFAEEVSGEGHAGTGEEQHWHRNWAAGFVGVTSEQRREDGLALGIEYARRLNKKISLGALAERTLGDLDFWVVAVPFGYSLGQWKFYAGPGVEIPDVGDNELLVRVGVEYVFEVGELEIAPQLDIDFVDGDEALVLGVTIGKSF